MISTSVDPKRDRTEEEIPEDWDEEVLAGLGDLAGRYAENVHGMEYPKDYCESDYSLDSAGKPYYNPRKEA